MLITCYYIDLKTQPLIATTIRWGTKEANIFLSSLLASQHYLISKDPGQNKSDLFSAKLTNFPLLNMNLISE